MTVFTESTVEEAVLEWAEGLEYAVLHGPDIAPGEPAAERASYGEVLLVGRLKAALARLNPKIPVEALDDALRKVTRAETPNLYENNRRFHRMLIDGIDVEYHGDGRIVHDKVWLVDFDHPEENDWLAVNQYTVTEDKRTRRPDVVLFVNGLPLVVIELKNAGDENATTLKAFRQLQTYKQELPTLLAYNAALVASDGMTARVGTLTADWERFMPWRTVDGVKIAKRGLPELDVLLRGVFERARFLDLVRHFIVFEVDGDQIAKKMAGYHQFHAVNKAVDCTLDAVSPRGNRRVGVVWHTQGSGKSLTMAFYAGKVIRHPKMKNPTLVVITDRNDLDDQLFGTFSACHALLRQKPVQAEDRGDLQEKLTVASGGVVFTTLQKFIPDEHATYPTLTDRRNVIVIADEAHRSQYGLKARVVRPKDKDEAHVAYGFAKHLRDAVPHASFIGFTGTPIEQADRSTPAVFGEYIDVYDIQRAVEDGATVKILYEGRLAKIELDASERPRIDPDFEEVTEGEEQTVKEKLKSTWARLEAMVGSEKRIRLIARDIVNHWEKRLDAMDGKAMIVCMSRRICVELYKAIINLRPSWHSDKDEEGTLKIVMTGSASDDTTWQPHIRSKKAREELAKRFKKADDPLRLVIVRDMWLTGFDAPCMHTMYVDKPMRGHSLMQAIARVNRVFRDKPGGLVVDYLGLAAELKKALAEYTEQDRDNVGIPTEQALEVLLEKYEVAAAMFHGFDYSVFFTGTPSDRLTLLANATDFVLMPQTAKESADERKQRFMQAAAELSKAFALVPTEDRAIEIREEVALFQCIRAQIAKLAAGPGGGKAEEDLDHAVRQIISRAVASDQVIDIFAAAGMQQPNIAILSDEFLAEVQGMPQRNLALEILRKLLNDEIKARAKKNLVQSRSFAEMLEKSIRAYQNRSLDAAQVIARLVQLARAREAVGLELKDKETELTAARAKLQQAQQAELDLRKRARELEELLRRQFPFDEIARVPKGVHGGDVLHHVRDSTGALCGTILWESKRTKSWSDAWLPKLRDDQRAAKAQIAMLATVEMPKGLANFGCVDGVWVTSRSCVLGLAGALRAGLIEVAVAKRALEGRQGKMELLYNYLSGPELRHRVEGIVEAYVTLRSELEGERRAMQRIWARREKQLERAVGSTAGLYAFGPATSSRRACGRSGASWSTTCSSSSTLIKGWGTCRWGLQGMRLNRSMSLAQPRSCAGSVWVEWSGTTSAVPRSWRLRGGGGCGSSDPEQGEGNRDGGPGEGSWAYRPFPAGSNRTMHSLCGIQAVRPCHTGR